MHNQFTPRLPNSQFLPPHPPPIKIIRTAQKRRFWENTIHQKRKYRKVPLHSRLGPAQAPFLLT